jgi:uncharacterized membrane protein
VLLRRNHEVSRLEAFSDAVFGFALTLLALSTSVPRRYEELMGLMWGLPAFICCFALLVWIWHEHVAFFDRHPIDDVRTLLLNSAILFTVLIYIYPLKFMFDALLQQVFGVKAQVPLVPMSLVELARASVLYGLGFFVLTGLFALLYLNAYRRRHDLDMTALQAFDARAHAGYHTVSAGIGLFAMLFALLCPVQLAFLSPTSFALMGPAHAIYGARVGKARKAFLARAAAPQET